MGLWEQYTLWDSCMWGCMKDLFFSFIIRFAYPPKKIKQNVGFGKGDSININMAPNSLPGFIRDGIKIFQRDRTMNERSIEPNF